jgi:hypothetical protein
MRVWEKSAVHRRVVLIFVMTALVGTMGACSSSVTATHAAGTWISGTQRATGKPTTPATTPPASTAPSVATLRAPDDSEDITVSGTSLFGWALLDRDTDEVSGSDNDATMTNTSESMIKPWIAADFLRRQDEAGNTPTDSQLADIRLMIIDSNDIMAQKYYVRDGKNAVINRFISICQLQNTSIGRSGWWSYTMVNPVDVTRYGECVADGTAAGKRWTPYLLKLMTQVRGDWQDQISDAKQGGRWGIIDGLPASLAGEVSIKNGWYGHVDSWHINCMAIDTHWVLAVEMHTTSMKKGVDVCASVARQLVVTG